MSTQPRFCTFRLHFFAGKIGQWLCTRQSDFTNSRRFSPHSCQRRRPYVDIHTCWDITRLRRGCDIFYCPYSGKSIATPKTQVWIKKYAFPAQEYSPWPPELFPSPAQAHITKNIHLSFQNVHGAAQKERVYKTNMNIPSSMWLKFMLAVLLCHFHRVECAHHFNDNLHISTWTYSRLRRRH